MANKSNTISLSEIKKHLYIDENGVFRRRVSRFKNQVNSIPGGIDAKGYHTIRINSIRYKTHRLYYMYYHNIEELDPDVYIDHINGNVSDNSITNLRIATPAQNTQNRGTRNNSNSGHRGVFWHKRDKKWTAIIGVNGDVINLGYYVRKEDAILAYTTASKIHHGEFGITHLEELSDAEN